MNDVCDECGLPIGATPCCATAPAVLEARLPATSRLHLVLRIAERVDHGDHSGIRLGVGLLDGFRSSRDELCRYGFDNLEPLRRALVDLLELARSETDEVLVGELELYLEKVVGAIGGRTAKRKSA